MISINSYNILTIWKLLFNQVIEKLLLNSDEKSSQFLSAVTTSTALLSTNS